MPRHSVSSRLNSTSRMTAINTEDYTEMKLDPEQLVPSEENFYELRDIEELADNMRLVGLIDPIVVGRVNGVDRIISGHRRREAALRNKRAGYEDFKEIRCLAKEMSENMFMLTLLSANAFTRKLTSFELLKQAQMMKVYIKKLQEEDGLEIPGKMRDYIADTLGISHTKMAQVESINNNLSQEGKDALERGELNFSKAYETSKLPEEKQREVIADDKLLSSDVKKMAAEMKEKKVEKPKVAQKEEHAYAVEIEVVQEEAQSEFSEEKTSAESMDDISFALDVIEKEMEKHQSYIHAFALGEKPELKKKYEVLLEALKRYQVILLAKRDGTYRGEE